MFRNAAVYLINDHVYYTKDPEFTSMMGRCFMHICTGWAPSVHDTKNQTNRIMTLSTVQFITYLDSFHGADHQNSLHHPGSKPTQQASGAVQSTGLVLRMVTEELKHPKPKENKSSREIREKVNGRVSKTAAGVDDDFCEYRH